MPTVTRIPSPANGRVMTARASSAAASPAACSPTAGAATLSSDGPVILGRNGLFEQEVRVAMPGPNSEQTGYRSWGSYDYVATLQHVRK